MTPKRFAPSTVISLSLHSGFKDMAGMFEVVMC